jgi:hypothetical protein
MLIRRSLPTVLRQTGFCRVTPRVCSIQYGTSRPVLLQTYFPSDHPYITKHTHDSMYTDSASQKTEKVLRKTDGEVVNVPDVLQIKLESTPIRKHLYNQASEMIPSVFFYNETNPHIGMLLNVKQCLYDYFQLVGPVKNSWFDILMCDEALLDLLCCQIVAEQEKQVEGAVAKSAKTAATNNDISISDVAAELQKLEMKKNVSHSKYEHTTTENIMQFDHSALSVTELTILQVLAQYASYPYELV